MIPRCPNCNNRVIQKSRDGKVRIRTNIIAFDGEIAEIVCKKCGSPVVVDVQLGADLRKALQPDPRLIVRKVVDGRNRVT